MRFTETPDAFLEDFGSAVVFGAVSGLGILDEPDQTVDGMGISTEYSLTVKHSLFGALTNGSSITIDGTTFKVREYRKLDDGVFGRATLSKP